MKNDPHYYQPNPDLKDQTHCLLYVINATTDLSNETAGKLSAIKEIRRKHLTDGNFIFFIFKTS